MKRQYSLFLAILLLVTIPYISIADIVYSERRLTIDGTNYVEQTWACVPTNPLSKNSGDIHITQTFDQHPHGEKGLDIKIYGNDIVLCAALSGRVIKVVRSYEGYGNYVIIETALGPSTLQLLYAHMIDGSIVLNEGQEVSEGQYIGKMGNTGKSSGPHLHFEVRYNGWQIDPEPFLNNQFIERILIPTF